MPDVYGARRKRPTSLVDLGLGTDGMERLLRRLVEDEDGQDVVEYALLTAGIGLAGAAAWPLVVNAIGTTYQQFDATSQSLWETPPPAK